MIFSSSRTKRFKQGRVRFRKFFRAALFATVVTPSIVQAQARRGAQADARRPQLTKPPELLEFVEAQYPESELAQGRDATVVLQIAISATGSVDGVAVITSAGTLFDAAAIEAVRKFRFSPAEIDNKPAPVKITYRYQFSAPIAAPTTGNFRGVVTAKRTGEPLANVTVELEGHGKTTTNERGEFTFDELPPGDLKVTLSREDLTPLQTQEALEAGRTVEARYTIELPPEPGAKGEEETDDFEIVVVAPRLVKQVVSTEVSADEAKRVPGTQGDVLKVVENLPGVARASAGSGEVVVWGAAPQDTRTYVGAVRIPLLYHFGGLRSVVHNDHVSSAELIPGGYGVAFGRGLGGLVLVKTSEPARDRVRGSVQFDLLDASLALAAPISKSWSASIAARRSHIADFSALLSDQSFQEFFTLPNYYDGQARVRRDIADGEWLEFGGLISGDKQSRTQPSNDPARRVSETKTLYFQRYDISYHKRLADGSEVDIAPWYGHDDSGRYGNFAGVPTSAETESHLVGFRSEWRGQVAPTITGRFGLDFELMRSTSRRNGSITSPPREGDTYLFGRAPADQVNFDEWKTTLASAAPYAELDFRFFGEKLHVAPGVRLDPYFISTNRRSPSDPNVPDQGASAEDIAIQPRLATKYSPDSRVAFKAAVGVYRQPPLPDDLSAVFGNPTLGISSGTHYLAGANYRLLEKISVEATIFHTRSEDLIARNPSATPRLSEALVQEGEGRSTGAQFLLRHDKGDGRFFGWVAYTLLRSERKDPDAARFRLFDFDQTHMLTALGSYDLGAGFEVGLRARIASGYPRTPVTGVYFDARKNRYEPTLGAYNTDRIPMFVQLDARASKRFKIGTSELEAYLDVQNVTNRQNPEEIAYSPDYSRRRYILGLPILPVLGARWSF